MRHYLLRGREPYEVDTTTREGLLAWARVFETMDRTVAYDKLPLARVSTVFLGLDHNFMDEGPPDIFETMIFVHPALAGSPAEDYQTRCSTWAQALEMHAKAMALVLPAHQEAAG